MVTPIAQSVPIPQISVESIGHKASSVFIAGKALLLPDEFLNLTESDDALFFHVPCYLLACLLQQYNSLPLSAEVNL
jgi:hypothetical protein